MRAQQILDGLYAHRPTESPHLSPRFDRSYDGSTLTETMTDTLTHDTFSTIYSVNIPGDAGGGLAYIGFTGGTGGGGSTQTVTDFLFQSGSTVPEPSSFALLSLGGLGLAIRAIRRRNTTAV